MKPAAHRELLAWALVATLTAVQLLSTAPLFGQTNLGAWYGVQRGAESAASCEALLRQLEVCTKQVEIALTEIRTGPTADLLLAEDGGSSDPLSGYAAAPLPDVAEITLHVNVTGFTPNQPPDSNPCASRQPSDRVLAASTLARRRAPKAVCVFRDCGDHASEGRCRPGRRY